MQQKDFVNVLNDELDKFNEFYIDKEEDAVIRCKTFEDTVKDLCEEDDTASEAGAAGRGSGDHMLLQSELVEFHGEIVLILNWSMLNYTALAKLLKKHDKLTGNQLRAKYLENARHYPFQSTDVMQDILSRTESMIKRTHEKCCEDRRASVADMSGGHDDLGELELPKVYTPTKRAADTGEFGVLAPEELSEVLKQTCVAIEAWQKIRKPKEDPESEPGDATMPAEREEDRGVKRQRRDGTLEAAAEP